MKIIETDLTNRKIRFVEFDTAKNWIENFPTDNWCLIIIADEKKPKYFNEIIRKSIDRNVGYICAIGKQHTEIRELTDEIIAIRESEIEDNYLPKHGIITVGDEDFENGIWYGLNLTFNQETDIVEIIILDLTKLAFKKITDLIKKMENGYLPAD